MTSRIILCCILLNSLSFPSSAQEVLHIHNGCHFDGDEIEREIYGYAPSNEAQQIISRITAVMGLEQNFTIKAANISNALATVEGDERYILYNTAFLEKIKSGSGTYWSAYCVLAHEIGHHLNFHKFTETDPQRRKRMELKADFFAGSTLQKMGASLSDAQAGIETFSLESESNTHPPKSARLEAIASGWKQAKEGANFKVEPPQYSAPKTVDNEKMAKEWYDKGFVEKDMAKQIEFYSNAIILKSDYADAFINRGNAKLNLGKYNEAIADYDQAIRLKPDYPLAFNNRGIAKNNLNKYAEAIADYDQAIRLKPDFMEAFYSRGLAKYYLSKHNEAIADFDQSIRLKPDYADAFYNRGFTKNNLGKYNEAIADYDQAISLNPKYTDAFNNRGNAKRELGKYTEAIADLDEAIRLDPKNPRPYANKGCALVGLGKYGAAIDSIKEAEKIDASFKTTDWVQKCKQEALSKLKD